MRSALFATVALASAVAVSGLAHADLLFWDSTASVWGVSGSTCSVSGQSFGSSGHASCTFTCGAFESLQAAGTNHRSDRGWYVAVVLTCGDGSAARCEGVWSCRASGTSFDGGVGTCDVRYELPADQPPNMQASCASSGRTGPTHAMCGAATRAEIDNGNPTLRVPVSGDDYGSAYHWTFAACRDWLVPQDTPPFWGCCGPTW